MADWGVNRVLIIQCCFLLFASAVFLCIFVRVFKTTGCFFDVQKISNHSLVCKFVQERRNRINGTVQDNKSAWWHWRIVRRLHCRDTYLVRILECMKKDSLQHTGNTGLILQNWSSWDCKIFARCQGILRLTVPCTSRGRWYRINGFSPRETQTHSNYDGDGNQLPEIFFIKCYLYAAPLYLLCNIIQISRDLACRACPIDIFRGAWRLAEKCEELLLIVQCVHSRFPNYDDELAHKLLFTVRGFLHEPMKSTYVSLRFLT